MSPHAVSLVVLVLLILFGLYRRMRRTIGFQPLRDRRMVTRSVLLGAVGVLLLVSGIAYPVSYLYDAVGIACGGVLTYYAIRTTTFEQRGGQWYYRPHPWIGAILLVLFVGRIAYRLYVGYAAMETPGAAIQPSSPAASNAALSSYAHDPLAAAVLFAIVTYYAAYATWLIRAERSGRLNQPNAPSK
ncbi:MAG: cytochrome c biogenesis protein CcdC [Alicyclobacillus sp.]|nr:cytochrome c biogenesis protein CcdC [Alicyclobacillus sp.]